MIRQTKIIIIGSQDEANIEFKTNGEIEFKDEGVFITYEKEENSHSLVEIRGNNVKIHNFGKEQFTLDLTQNKRTACVITLDTHSLSFEVFAHLVEIQLEENVVSLNLNYELIWGLESSVIKIKLKCEI